MRHPELSWCWYKRLPPSDGTCRLQLLHKLAEL